MACHIRDIGIQYVGGFDCAYSVRLLEVGGSVLEGRYKMGHADKQMIQGKRDFSWRSVWLLLQNWLLIALGVLLAAHTSAGISYDDGASLVLVVLLFSFFNLVLKPLLVFFTLPFIIVTFGLGIWIINAVVLMFASGLVPGFHVASFSSALWGAFVISLTSLVVNMLLAPPQVRRFSRPSPKPSKDDDVIDI